jgi:hypothetical protein
VLGEYLVAGLSGSKEKGKGGLHLDFLWILLLVCFGIFLYFSQDLNSEDWGNTCWCSMGSLRTDKKEGWV